MLIALLAVLGVDLIVIGIFAGLVLGRRRWLKHQSGQFTGAIRVPTGEVDGLSSTWKRGSGRWVRDLFVWEKGPFLYRTVLVPIDGLAGERQAGAGEVKRLGDEPVVAEFGSGDATVEIAAKAEDRSRLAAPFSIEEEAGTSRD